MKALLPRFLKNNKSDISPVEYVLIAALIWVVIMIGVRTISGKLSGADISAKATSLKRP